MSKKSTKDQLLQEIEILKRKLSEVCRTNVEMAQLKIKLEEENSQLKAEKEKTISPDIYSVQHTFNGTKKKYVRITVETFEPVLNANVMLSSFITDIQDNLNATANEN